MERPRTEYLLPAGEYEAISALMALGPPWPEAERQRLHEYDSRISQLVVKEAFEEAERAGATPMHPCGHITNEQALGYVLPERRAWEFSMRLEGVTSNAGLGQVFGDCEDEVPGMIEAMLVLGIEDWAKTIAIISELIWGPESVPESLRGRTEGFTRDDWSKLEQEICDTHLMPVRMRHALRHRELFFAD